MKGIFKWIKNNPNRFMFLIPILLVAAISISHVVTWYDMANPINWAIYLSVAIEIAAMTALVAASTKVRGGVWFISWYRNYGYNFTKKMVSVFRGWVTTDNFLNISTFFYYI